MTPPEGDTTRLALVKHTSRRNGELEIHDFGLRVPSELRWLRGHFEGNPVLPAVVQLQEVFTRARELWPDLAIVRRVPRAKFSRPVRPGDSVLLRLARREGGSTISFEYLRVGKTCSAGKLEFSPRER